MIALLTALALANDPARDEAFRKLGSIKLTVDFDKTSLTEAVDFLRDATGVNLVILPAATLKEERPVRLKAKELPALSVLKLVLNERGLALRWRDGAVVILPREDVDDDMELRVYDVRARLMKLPDFPGPTMELTPRGPGHVYVPGVVVGNLEEPKAPIEPDFLVDLVKESTGGRSWGNVKASIQLVNGQLIVVQSAATHRQIAALLSKLSRF
jgi:hypothetical protein